MFNDVCMAIDIDCSIDKKMFCYLYLYIYIYNVTDKTYKSC